MKAKFWIIAVLCLFTVGRANADEDAGPRFILTRGKVLCGTNTSVKSFALRDKDGNWSGIDADLCRVFSYAFFGRGDRFEIVNVPKQSVEEALRANRIDIMLGGDSVSAGEEIAKKYSSSNVIYYDKQVFLARKIDGATSMDAYKEAKVCAASNSEDYANVQKYSTKFGLNFNMLLFPSSQDALQAFLLKRCDIVSGGEIYLKGVMENYLGNRDDVTLIPEPIAAKQVYAFVETQNKTLSVIFKWILNALYLAEDCGINSQNVAIFNATNDASIRYLLGIDPSLWKKFELEPLGIKQAIIDVGNFGEIYEKNLGMSSRFQIERGINKLSNNGGLIIPLPFL